MEIAVIGMGYVGIPSAAMFADVDGFRVIGIQRRSKRSGWKIDWLNAGKCPIAGDEPGLAKLIEKVVKKGSFKATDDISACKTADAILIDVQTPVNENHVPVYDSLREVSEAAGKYMKKGAIVVIESTVAPGTTNYFVKPILEEYSGMKAGELYSHIVKAELFPTNCLTAEVAKVAENTYRDVNIAFANEMALICESLGVNVHEVRRFVNSLPYDPSDPGKNPFRMMHIPGPGVGGHCLPKDPWLLKYGLDEYGTFKHVPRNIIESRRLNDFMPQHMKDLMEEALGEKGVRLKDAGVCILGFAYLENSDDTRNTPTLTLYNLIKGVCKDVVIHDPYVKEYERVNLTDNLEEAINGKDCIIVITKHREYHDISLDWLKEVLNTHVIVDGRNLFDPKVCIKAGFSFRGVGVGNYKN